jgi:membrane-anchored protein YejM (alkaline phosphatase superfamily)
MKSKHHKSLKFHTIFSIMLSIIFIAVLLINQDITLFTSAVFLLIYITGNGLIHSKTNKLSRDTMIEYIILSIIALLILLGTISR